MIPLPPEPQPSRPELPKPVTVATVYVVQKRLAPDAVPKGLTTWKEIGRSEDEGAATRMKEYYESFHIGTQYRVVKEVTLTEVILGDRA